MLHSLKSYIKALRNPTMIPTALRVACIIGTLLFLINHGNALLQGKMTKHRWFAGILTYIVPYCVNIHGQWSSHQKRSRNQA